MDFPEDSEFYNEAMDHLTKDRPLFFQERMELRTLIEGYNQYVRNIHPRIISRIEEGLAIGSLGYRFHSTTRYMTYVDNIYTIVRENLTSCVTDDSDLYQAFRDFEKPSKFQIADHGNEQMGESILKEIKKDENLRKMLEAIQTRRKEVQEQLTKLIQITHSVSKKISAKNYNTKRRCCPTFWTLLDDYLT